MRINFPFFYNVVHRRDNGEVSTRPLMDIQHTEVAELTNADVGVAARWDALVDQERYSIECLTWHGNTYLPTRTRDGDSVTPYHLLHAQFGYGRAGLVTSVCEFYGGVISHGDHSHLLYEWLSGNKSKIARPKGGTVLSSTEEEVADLVRYMAERAFILDGRVWQRVSGLHCEIFKSRNRYNDILTFGEMDYSKNDGAYWARQWKPRGFRWWEETRISLNDVRDGQWLDGERVNHQFHNLEIVQPEAFEFDTRGRFLDRFVKYLIRETGQNAGDFDAELMGQWLDLRESLETSNHAANDTIGKLEGLRDAPISSSARRMLEKGLERWRKLEELLHDSARPARSKALPSP